MWVQKQEAGFSPVPSHANDPRCGEGGGFGVRKVEFRFKDEAAEKKTFPRPHPQIAKAPNPKFEKGFNVN